MKTLTKLFALAIITAFGFSATTGMATLEVSAEVQINATADFQVPLAKQGVWVEVGSYGHCWHPSHVEVGWRPYCDGTWVWTDCGWYWMSDEPWAWACYHYGTWVYDDQFGWLWVPGIEWAPAWVEWRIGGGYCGWAPLAPPGVTITVRNYVFVETHHFGERIRPSTVVVNDTKIITKTKVVGGVRSAKIRLNDDKPQKVMFDNGPSLDIVQKDAAKKIHKASMIDVIDKTPVPTEVKHQAKSKVSKVVQPEKRSQNESDRKPGEKSAPDKSRGDLKQDPAAPSVEPPGVPNTRGPSGDAPVHQKPSRGRGKKNNPGHDKDKP